MEHVHLASCYRRQSHVLFLKLQRALSQIQRQISYSFELQYALYVVVYYVACPSRNQISQLYKIAAHMVRHEVYEVLVVVDLFGDVFVVIVYQRMRPVIVVLRGHSHLDHGFAHTGYGQRGRSVQGLVQQLHVVELLGNVGCRTVFDEFNGGLFQKPGKRQQDHRAAEPEYGMGIRYAAGSDRAVPYSGQCASGMQYCNGHRYQNHYAEVEQYMSYSRAFRVSLRAYGADDGSGNAVADVDADDYRIYRAEREHAGGGQRLKNTYRSGGALDQERGDSSGDETEKRPFGNAGEHVHEPGLFSHRADSCGHVKKSGEKYAEAHGDLSDRSGVLLLDEHYADYSDDRRYGGKCAWFEEIQERSAGGVDVQKSYYLGGDGGAYVSSEHYPY